MYFNKKQFSKAMKEMLQIILVVLGVVWFCVFIYRHSGLDVEVREEDILEYVSYEYVVETSPENFRVKEAVPQHEEIVNEFRKNMTSVYCVSKKGSE